MARSPAGAWGVAAGPRVRDRPFRPWGARPARRGSAIRATAPPAPADRDRSVTSNAKRQLRPTDSSAAAHRARVSPFASALARHDHTPVHPFLVCLSLLLLPPHSTPPIAMAPPSTAPAFVPPPLNTHRLAGTPGAAATNTTGTSAFTGSAVAAATPTSSRTGTRTRMAAGATPSSSSAAAAALRAAGGVDPANHHVLAVLRRASSGAHVASETATDMAVASTVPSWKARPTSKWSGATSLSTTTLAAAPVMAAAAVHGGTPTPVAAAPKPVAAWMGSAPSAWADRQARYSAHVAAKHGDGVAASPALAQATSLTPTPTPGSTTTTTMSSAGVMEMRLNDLLSPPPASSPLEAAAAALATLPMLSTTARAPTAAVPKAAAPAPEPLSAIPLTDLLSPPVADSPLESTAAVLADSADRAPTRKAATAPPQSLSELLFPPPSGESPLEAAALRLSPLTPTSGLPSAEAEAPEEEEPPATLVSLLSPPEAPSPLTAAAKLLETGGPRLTASTDKPADLKSLLSPPPAMSPLERAAARLFGFGANKKAAPVAEAPTGSRPVFPAEALPESLTMTLGEFLDTKPAMSPLEAAAAVLERSANLDPTGKAAMEEPPRLAALLSPEPAAESPLEQMAANLFPPPPKKPMEEEKEAETKGPLTLGELLTPPPAATPLEASAAVLARSAELSETGKAAMDKPTPVKDLMTPASAETPLEEVARRLAAAEAAAASSANRDSADANAPASASEAKPAKASAAADPSASAASGLTLTALLTPPAGLSPLESTAAVLAANADASPCGRAATAPPPLLASMLSPTVAIGSPLEKAAAALAAGDDKSTRLEKARQTPWAPTRDGKLPIPAPLTSPEELEKLLCPCPACSPLTMAADALEANAQQAGKASNAAVPAKRLGSKSRRSGGAPVVPLSTGSPTALPSFVTAAVTGTSAPAGAGGATVGRWGTVVPPVLTAAFVGACLALSHIGPAIGAPLL